MATIVKRLIAIGNPQKMSRMDQVYELALLEIKKLPAPLCFAVERPDYSIRKLVPARLVRKGRSVRSATTDSFGYSIK
ncbi:MAG TPA: hypothetical protein VFC26_10825 [Verrucomicrobiae bacterium]|nr:hypothetical protein [Verrucomicrobiae bacterium]